MVFSDTSCSLSLSLLWKNTLNMRVLAQMLWEAQCIVLLVLHRLFSLIKVRVNMKLFFQLRNDQSIFKDRAILARRSRLILDWGQRQGSWDLFKNARILGLKWFNLSFLIRFWFMVFHQLYYRWLEWIRLTSLQCSYLDFRFLIKYCPAVWIIPCIWTNSSLVRKEIGQKSAFVILNLKCGMNILMAFKPILQCLAILWYLLHISTVAKHFVIFSL